MCWVEDICSDTLPPTLLFRAEWLIAGDPIQKNDPNAFDDAAASAVDPTLPINLPSPLPTEAAIASPARSAIKKAGAKPKKSTPPLPKTTLPLTMYLPVALAAPLLWQ
mmetsp:Transcript_42241/g.88702  ORF Transcript_42241/g.88702 Transcript_42241/m.88702 type:complete len:108 (-) Transcript_42241:907-1230(-)